MYANDMMSTRKMIHLSYSNAVKREKEKRRILYNNLKDEEISEAMQMAREEFKRVQSRENKRR